MGPDATILDFWMLSFKPTFSVPSFTFIKKLFSSSSLSPIRVVSSAYLRLLIFLLAILIPAYVSSSLACCVMYSAYKLNKQGDSIQPCCTPFTILNQPVVPCKALTLDPKYRFLTRQVGWSGIPNSLRIFHSSLWSTQSKALAYIVNEAEVDAFWNFFGFSMIQQILAIWSLVLLPLQNPACISGSSWFMYCWSLAWRILSITLLAC